MCSETVKITNRTQRESDAVNRRDLFGEQIRHRHQAQHQVVAISPTGISTPPILKLNGIFVFLIVALVAQHQHAQRLQEEAPHHAERVRFAQQIDVAAAQPRS